MTNDQKPPDQRDPYMVLGHYYDIEHQHLVSDVEFYQDLARAAGSDVLDLACGTGRVGLSLAQQDRVVVGIDTSDTMLTIANGKIRRQKVPMTLRRLDMRKLDFTSEFDLVICALDSFGHMLTISDQEACLAGIFRSLRPGGLVAIDVMSPSPGLLATKDGTVFLQSEFEGPHQARIKHFTSWLINYELQQLHVEHMYDYVATDASVKRRQSGYRLRYFFRFEMELLLRNAGFQVKNIYSDYHRSEYIVDGERMLFIAARN